MNERFNMNHTSNRKGLLARVACLLLVSALDRARLRLVIKLSRALRAWVLCIMLRNEGNAVQVRMPTTTSTSRSSISVTPV